MSMKQSDPRRRSVVSTALIEAVLLLLGAALVPVIVFSDRHIFMHGFSEHSRAEILQAALTALAASIYWVRSVQLPDCRSWLQALAGFFTIVLIREMDFYLDYIYHGFWSLLASLCLVLVLVMTWRSRHTFRTGLVQYLAHNAHVYVMIGVVIVVLFSRIFGSSDFLLAIMEEQYNPAFKTSMQEGLELFGYFLIAMGSAKYAITPHDRKG